jgi:hypothetical protein
MAGLTQIDLTRQAEDGTLSKSKLKSDFLEGGNLDLTGGNNNATITGLANGVDNDDAVNKGQMDAAIAAALTGSMNYKGTIDASVATGVTLDGAETGDFYYVSVAGTLDGIAFNVGDHLVVNADITDFDVDGSGKIDIIDNTESTDIIRTSDIIDDLVTGGTQDALSAQQGVVLKGLVDNLQSELDDTQTGAGLGTDGSYTANGAANYISTATSLKNADDLLDAQIKTNADDIAALQTDLSERVFTEVPTVTNGSPTLAALANIPVKAGTARVYLNGLRQLPGGSNDYTINETTGVITFNFNLKDPKDTVIVDYEY